MPSFIREGGVPALILLVFSAVAIVAAARFAWRPDERKLGGIRALNQVVLMTIGFATAMDVYVTLRTVGQQTVGQKTVAQQDEAEMTQVLLIGLSESLAPAVLGFASLSVVWMLVAAGHRRLNA